MTSTAVSADANTGTTAVRDGFSFDEDALTRWMAAHVTGFAGPLTVRQFKGGQSNPTYQLVTPAKTYVLRRKPTGQLAKSAHAVDREARVLTALASADFPVPKVYGLCTDLSVIGSWFYVMDMVEGRIFWDATFSEVPERDRPSYFCAMNETLARLHLIAPQSVGLEDYGPAGNYFERQISRWSRSYLADTDAGRDPGMDKLVEWLPTAIPRTADTRIVHGDFRCDNLIFHPTAPRVIAVLDWELSTLGCPLADFTYHALMYRMPPEIVAGMGNLDPASLDIPTEDEYVAQYCAATGRTSIPDYPFYVAFNLFRMAAIFHGIKGRVIRGQAASAHSVARVQHFPKLVQMAVNAAEECR
ncbi:phosphotransferase [Sulfitobacter sp. JBTF-M27]|uniref:Phosphotransferase n=1 Tax=Sulfitobacter sediminilitoris TaxID=2698830 RepID=A0A6P0CH20_9RHOB|nr:phosphotransferase [Sulfitobacter sediminilitoris]NEK24386.1 phosphotransferase [Sulfitobacter sediminilitoris]